MAESKQSIFQRINSFRKAITVEPVSFLMLLGSVLASTTSQTLALDKTCRVNLNLSEAICDAVRLQDTDDNAENERTVQEYVAGLIAYKSIITSVVPCILLIFTGGWMDVTGRRKIMMILPVAGEIGIQINNIINVIFFYHLRVEYLIFGEAVFSAAVGAWSIMFLAVFSYIVDITTEKNRTYRLGLVSFCVYIGMPIGAALSGFLLKLFGYLTVYIVSLIVFVINFSYIVLFLSDPERTKEHKEHDNRGFIYFMKTFFSPAHLLNSLRVLFRKTENNRTALLCILIASACFVFGPMYGESAIMYMSTRYRFGWDELQYSFFQTYNMTLNIIGTMFSILVISKALGWHDSVMGILSTSSKILASFVYCFATTGTLFFLGPLTDILHGTSYIALRSIISKSVEPDEIGRLISLVSLIEVLMPLLYVPLYTRVYTATMGVMPGFVFLMGAALTVPPLLVFIWLLYKHLKTQKLSKADSVISS